VRLLLVLIAGATLVNALTSRTPASGRALFREIRSSFYRKLVLRFVTVAVAPVVILAIVTRQYFANQFQSGIEEAAAKRHRRAATRPRITRRCRSGDRRPTTRWMTRSWCSSVGPSKAR